MDTSDFPALFQAANQVAISGQRRYKRLASLELVLLVTGAVAGTTLALVGGRGRVGATIGGLVFLSALAIRLLTRKRADDAAWFDGAPSPRLSRPTLGATSLLPHPSIMTMPTSDSVND